MKALAPRLQILPAAQQRLWPELRTVPRRFVLYGGTAIALRFGHRASVDFDFFASENFQVAELIEELPWLHHCQRLQSKPGTLTVIADRGEPVKLSFFGGLSIGRVGEPELTNDEVVSVASSLDLAATKMAVIQQRAEQKDYLDAARLLQAGIQLPDALGAAHALYGEIFNPMITLKALGYFRDGDLPGLPEEIKVFLSETASQVRTIPALPRASDRISAA